MVIAFRDVIKTEMARRSCSMTRLSKLSGLSLSMVSRLLSGECKFHESNIDAMLKALKLSAVLVARDDKATPVDRFSL